MPNFDYLLGGQVAQVDPMRIAMQGATLADIASQARVRQMLLEKQQRDMQAQDDLNAVLPQVMSANWSPQALQAAVQSRPGSAGTLLDMLDKKRASDATYAKTSAEAEAKSTDSAVAKLRPLTAQAYALANKPGPLTADEVRGLYGNIAGNGLQGLVVNLPFKDWTNESSVRDNLRTIGSAFFEAEKQAAQAETRRKNMVDEGLNREKFISEDTARKASTAQGWANVGISRDRLNYDRESGKDVYDPERGILVNKGTGASRPVTDGGGVPIGAKKDPAIEAGRSARIDMANRAISIIDEALPKVSWMTTGGIGGRTQNVPGTPAYNFKEEIAPIKSMLTIDTLTAMRQASPTGGALGNVSDRENAMLAAAVASLETAQSPEQVRTALGKVRTHLSNVRELMAGKMPSGSGQITTGASQPADPLGIR